MKLTLSLFILLCLCRYSSFCQTSHSVRGIVSDTVSKQRIDNATISVLNAADSILQKFTYTDKGVFEINGLKPGKFILMVTYPDYADFVENFVINAIKPSYDFGNIKMIQQAQLLNEVIIKARVAAIKIKGDTTEFNAAAYATQKNAKVEDLLKELQGMKINQSGAIIFQGEQVSKVLVDGEEFFSDDPSLVTKNLRADMVNKIQVYDQKSEQAKLTGIEDGVKVKTINIVLSEDKKKGVFGKMEGGYATDDYYVGQAMFNKFSPKEKISAYGNIGNTGKVGLSSADNNKFGSGYSTGTYNGIGIPFARDGGAHYDKKWNKDKQSINANYKLGALTTEGANNTQSQVNLPGNYITRDQNRNFRNYNFTQSMNGAFTSRLDSMSDLSANLSGVEGNGKSESNNKTSTSRGNGVLQNFNETNNDGDNKYRTIDVRANYTRRFKKKGRSLSINGNTSFSDNQYNSFLLSDLIYYDAQGNQDSTNHIDQYKPSDTKSSSFSGGLSYSDILSKTVSVGAGFNYSRSTNNNRQRSFNRSGPIEYNELDSLFSSEFRLINTIKSYTMNINYNTAKTAISISNTIGSTEQEQIDLFLSEASSHRTFTNWQPAANYRYQLSKAASLSFNYYGYTRQPSNYDLQPIRQNSNPLNITLGNPELKPSFSSQLYYNYRVYQPTKDQGINLRGWYGNTINAIVYNRSTDSAGVNISQAANMKDKTPSNWNIYAEVYGHATKLDFILSINFTMNGNINYNYINSELNKAQTILYSPQIDIWKNKANYSYGFSIGPEFTTSSNSLQRQVNNNSKGFHVNTNGFAKLPRQFFIGADINYQFTGKNQVFDRNFEQALLKAHFGKSFLKDEGLKISIIGNDLLNQNTGYTRSGTDGNFSESRNTTIRRHFMFSVTWDFSKFGKSLQRQQQ